MVSGLQRRTVRRAEVALVLGAGVALAASWVIVAVQQGVPGWEVQIFGWVNGLPDALWPIVWAPMQLGSLPGSLAVVAGTYAVSRNTRLTLAALTASQIAWWSAKAIKLVVARGRPEAVLADLRLREHASGVGYVSGHSAVAFALASVLAPSLPRQWRPVAFGLATVVALGRLYAGAHLPLDAVGGAGLGVLVGTGTRWAFGLGGAGLPATD